MAGSYNHAVTKKGKLRTPENIHAMLDSPGDVFETIEEMYGMIWYLSGRVSTYSKESKEVVVDDARKNYVRGILNYSPGRQK